MYGLRLMLMTHSRELIKLCIWIAVVAAVAYYHVADLILTFCLGGFVPGTSFTLSPLWAMAVSAGAIILTAAWLLLWVRLQHTKKMRHYSMRRPVVTRESHIFAAQMSNQDDRETAHRRRLGGFFPSLRRHLQDVTVLALALLLQGCLFAVVSIASLAVGVVTASQAIWRPTWLAGRYQERHFVQLLSDLWQWLDPFLSTCDEWLELQFREGEAWTSRRLSRYDSIRVMKSIVDDWTGRAITAPATTRRPRK